MEKFPFQKMDVQNEKFLNALAEAYRLQEAIIDTTELSIISTDKEGLITSFNKAAEVLLGYSAEEVIGRVTPAIFHDWQEIKTRSHVLSLELNTEVLPSYDTFVLKARIKKVADRNEWTYIRKDRSRFPVLLSVTGLWEDDTLIGYAGIATDITEARKREQLLKNSEAHLQTLLNSIDDIAFEINKERIYTNIWTKNDHLLVTPRKEYVGKKISEVWSGDLLHQFDSAIELVLKTQKPQYLEYAIPNTDRWSSSKISYIDDHRVLMLVRNITDKKKAELELAGSEQKFRAIAENIPGAIYLCRNDETYSMIYLNDKVNEITGYEAHEFISNRISFVELYHPGDKDYIVNLVEKALNDRVSFQLEYRIQHKSGEWRWLEEVGTGVYDTDSLILIEGFISDITPRKIAEEELRRMADENSRVFNNSIHLNCIANFDGYFLKLNPAWEKTLGWTVEELKSQKFIEFVFSDDHAQTVESLRQLAAGTTPRTTNENRYRCKDGSYRWLLWSSSPDVNRKLIYASAIDITERKKSEEELQRSKTSLEVAALELKDQNRQLDDFAHIISHNMRSPIGNINALIGLLNDRSSIEDYHLIFEKLSDVSKNLSETMNELMETLKVKKNTDVVQTQLHFQEILEKVIQSLQGEIIQTNTVIRADFKVSTIHYSKTYLESIFQNLISNAIKYKAKNKTPEILISTIKRTNAIELRISDNGLGIDMALYGDKLFGLHKTFHDHKEARGVGLFLVKTQIEALGGSIHVESQVDKGTTFIIRFAQ
jgi:PAS domain S-box-containing protein